MARHWSTDGLEVDEYERAIFGIADHTIDVRAVLGAWVRFRAVSAHLAHLYDTYLFDGCSLQDVPDSPLFVFNTTNMQTGDSFQWTKEAGHDYVIGNILRPDIALSTVVAASSAFPPMLSPSRFPPPGTFVDPATGQPVDAPPGDLWLTDGGVYDNLGLQPVDHLQTLLVSDAGAPFGSDVRLRRNWLSLTLRTLALLQDQVAKRRRYEELYAPDASTKQRLFWSLRPEHPVPGIAAGGLDVPPDRVHALSKTHTRLAKLPSGVHYQLANLGYALADHRVRPVLRPGAAPPTSFPFPGGLG
jgi:NTE family protein